MGQARNRGTFEERKAQAVKDKRYKLPLHVRRSMRKVREAEILRKMMSVIARGMKKGGAETS
jgi:hypothetical protein